MESISMWLSPDRSSASSISQQLVDQLRGLIVQGRVPSGETLPSTRALADELEVSRSVVVRAYEQLNGEGYVEAVPGSRTRVVGGAGLSTQLPRNTVTRHEPARPTRTNETRQIDLRTGFPFLPVSTPEEWRRALTAASRAPLRTRSPDPLGEPMLREQVALHAQLARGIRCSPDDVIITAGTVDALLLLAVALGRDTGWFAEDPGYPEAARVLRATGAQVTPIPVSPQGMQARLLDTAAAGSARSAALVTPSHQFPLGGRMPASQRAALIDWANRNGAVIVEDDYDSEFRYVGAALPAIAALDPGGIVAHIGSLNKSFSPSLRCGYVVSTSGSQLWESLVSTKRVLGSNVSLPVQQAVAKFFESGGFRRYLARTKREYRSRRQLLLDLFEQRGATHLLSGLDGGLHCVMRLPDGLVSEQAVQHLASHGVLAESMREFSQLGAGADAIAIGYGQEPVLRLEQGLHQVLDLLGTTCR